MIFSTFSQERHCWPGLFRRNHRRRSVAGMILLQAAVNVFSASDECLIKVKALNDSGATLSQ